MSGIKKSAGAAKKSAPPTRLAGKLADLRRQNAQTRNILARYDQDLMRVQQK